MEFQVRKYDGTPAAKIQVDDSVFGIEPNESVVHRAVVVELSNRRQGTHASKNRSLVSGGGRKPWRQKGRGVARAGTTRSPLWRGGGTVFGPEPHRHYKTIPKKMKRLARCSALSTRAAQQAIVVVDEIKLEEPRTKALFQILAALDVADKKVKILPAVLDRNLILSARNLPNVSIVKATDASTYELLDSQVLLFDRAGLSLLNEQLKARS
jgi:large subunit ribosomal protein L4